MSSIPPMLARAMAVATMLVLSSHVSAQYDVDPELRIQQLEQQLRTLTGQNEELQHRNRTLEQQLQQLQRQQKLTSQSQQQLQKQSSLQFTPSYSAASAKKGPDEVTPLLSPAAKKN